MRPFLLLLLAVFCFTAKAQQNCVTKKVADKTITTCNHSNGKPSTVESWDSEKHWGGLKGYDSNGKELFSYDLRKVAGHASVYVDYHKNGQVKKAEYSSAPDGGIQYYHIISEYDESGKQTSYVNLSRPDGYPSLITIQTEPNSPEPERKAYVVEGPLNTTVFQVKNETNSDVLILVKSVPGSQYREKREESIVLKPKQLLIVDSISLNSLFLKQEAVLSVELGSKQKRNRRFTLITASPAQATYRKTYSWHIVEE